MQRKERILRKYFKRVLAPLVRAVVDKLVANEREYRWGNLWARKDWAHDLRVEIRAHVEKGDPIDVIIYGIFAWLRGWSLAWPMMPQEPLVYTWAEPVEFEAQNQVIRCGPIPNCRPIPCFVSYGDPGGASVTSCWRLSPAAQAEVAATGLVYVNTVGEIPPPVYVDGLNFINPNQIAVAAKLIRSGQVRVMDMETAVALDEKDRAATENRQTFEVASAFDENGAVIQAAIQRLGREFIDAIDDDQAGSSSSSPRPASYYPHQFVLLLGKAALAFFTAYPEYYEPDQVAEMVKYGDEDNRFDRELGPELLDAMSQYQNRPTDDDDDLAERGDLGAKPEQSAVDDLFDRVDAHQVATDEALGRWVAPGTAEVSGPSPLDYDCDDPAPDSIGAKVAEATQAAYNAIDQITTAAEQAAAESTQRVQELALGFQPGERQQKLDAILADALAGQFERLKEIGTRVVDQSCNMKRWPAIKVNYNGQALTLEGAEAIEAHVKTAFDYYFPLPKPGIVTYLTQTEDEAQAARADRNVQPLADNTRVFLRLLWEHQLKGSQPDLERFADQWNQTIDRALRDFLEMNSGFSIEELARYASMKELGSFALLDGFPTLHEAAQAYLAKYRKRPRQSNQIGRDWGAESREYERGE